MNKLTISKKHLFILLLILLLAGFLRLYKLGTQSLVADEYIGINISYGVHKTGEWKYWDFNEGTLTDRDYTRGQIYYWQVAKIFDFLEPTEANSRLISVLWGMIGVLSIFGVAWLTTKNVKIALLAAFLASISISNLIYDRKLRMYSMFAPLYLLFVFVTYFFLESKKYLQKNNIISQVSKKLGLNLYFLPLVLILGYASYLTHFLTINIAPTIVVYFLISGALHYKKSESVKTNKYFLYLGAALVLAIAFSQMSLMKNAFRWIDIGAKNWSYFEKINLDYSYLGLGLVLMAIGTVYLWKKFDKIGIWTVLAFAVPFFSAVFLWDRNAGTQYIYLVQPFKIIIVATAIHFIAKTVHEKVFEKQKYSYFVVVLILLTILINFAFFFSDRGFYQKPSKWAHPNYREAFQYYLLNREANSVLATRPLTKYYLKDSQSNLIEYDTKNKLSLQHIQEAQTKYDQIWIIFTKETHIKSDAKKYIAENFEKEKTKHTNNVMDIWVWENKKQSK